MNTHSTSRALPGRAAPDDGDEFTIDSLARAGETTVRSIRVYHERGVLPPPEVRGRIGYYSPDHLKRLRTISRLLSRGMKLNGIKELLDAWDRGEGLADLLGVDDEEDAEPTPQPPPAHDGTSEYLQCLVEAGVPREQAHAEIQRLRAQSEHTAALIYQYVASRGSSQGRLVDDVVVMHRMSTRAAGELLGRALRDHLAAEHPELALALPPDLDGTH